MRLIFIASTIILTTSIKTFAQEPGNLDSLLNMSAFTEETELQKNLNQATSVASGKALTTRETPGILSVVSSEDISKSGARDITDILRLVPGFEIMQDIQFVTGVGFRGSWANEGKVLFLIDGHQINELLYQTVPLINNFPVDAIEKIEIIRGPGSAVYGGSAEYAVINIITKQAASLNGLSVYGLGGFHKSATGRTNGGLMAAQKGKKFSWDLGAFRSKGIVSDRPYQNIYGDIDPPADLAEITRANSTHINLGVKSGGLSFRAMYNDYETNSDSLFATYSSYSADIKYDWKVSDKLTVTPQLSYYNQIPWSYGDEIESQVQYEVRAIRTQGGVTLNQGIGRKVNLTYGALFFADKAEQVYEGSDFNNGEIFKMSNFAVFAQGLYKHRLFNLTAGARYEQNSKAGDAFVPRLAITKKIENFHFKLLYSEAFRTPSIENQNLAATGKTIPEKSRVGEIELGYQITPDMLLAVNAFAFSTKNVIIYEVDNDGQYNNYDKSGSKGVEAIYSIHQKKWNAKATYSIAVAGPNTVPVYEITGFDKSFVGFPVQKFTLAGNFDVTKKLSINTTAIASGKRYAYTTIGSNAEPAANKLSAYTLLNFFVQYANIVQGLNAGVGVYDALDKQPPIPQAYNGYTAPIPGRSREFVIKLSYQFNFKGE